MTGRLIRALLSTALLATAIAANPLSSSRPHIARAAAAVGIPTGLPTHFGIGLAAHPDSSGIYGWMPNSNIPWDYAYQYLSGGVNTGGGWETWNSNGQFALYYAQGAASHNYIPVFSYYELLQSNGSCGSCGEAQKDLSNLNNPSVMASYFQNFALLMKRLGSGTYDGIAGFGKTAIVHVEPDLSGYAEQAALNGGQCYGYCSGQGNDPSLLKAAVKSSGDADVANYPDTYQGFNWALLHLRDLYAPNVLLAFHVSNWATATDIGSDTSSTLDAAALGQEAGSFAAQSGASTTPSGTSRYDLIFNDVSDRDAGYYKYVYGNNNAFWDRLNVSFPNFHRWETYIGAITGVTGRPAMIWQIPEGNQYFDTENNTNGHYQDNRAEYFFNHIGELAQSGIIGLLFGAGNGGSTVNNDGMNDGVTNPASFCTSDGVSSGQVCNNHTSTVSDDDGGYLRMEGQQYYAGGGYALNGPAPANTPTGTPVPPTASATNTPAPPTTAASATNTPALPTNTPASLNVSATGGANPAAVTPGGTVDLAATVSANGALSGAIVDFEVYDTAGTKVYQTYQSPVTLAANAPQTLHASWSVPTGQAAGTYTLKVGVFDASWSTLYTWNNSAATVTVAAAAATSTATAVPPTATGTATMVPPTATKTSTSTAVPPTATSTPRPTNTPVPPTMTATATGVPTTAATPTSASCSTIVALNSGGRAASPFVADADVSGGHTYSKANTVNTGGVTNPAPQAVYRSERYGNFSYVVPNLTPGATYTVRLHFAEIYWNAAGKRVFDVAINGAPVLSNFDIYAAAGGANRAIVKTFTATANSSGKITIAYTTIVDDAKSSGVEIQKCK